MCCWLQHHDESYGLTYCGLITQDLAAISLLKSQALVFLVSVIGEYLFRHQTQLHLSNVRGLARWCLVEYFRLTSLKFTAPYQLRIQLA